MGLNRSEGNYIGFLSRFFSNGVQDSGEGRILRYDLSLKRYQILDVRLMDAAIFCLSFDGGDFSIVPFTAFNSSRLVLKDFHEEMSCWNVEVSRRCFLYVHDTWMLRRF